MVTLAEAKTYLGISVTTYDTLIETFIEYTTDEIETFVDRNLVQSQYSNEVIKFEFSDFDLQEGQENELDLRRGRPAGFLTNYPIVAVTGSLQLAITYKGNTLIEDTDYIVDPTNGVVDFYNYPSDYKKNILATYTAGYTIASGSYQFPAALRLVALDGIKLMFQKSGTTSQGSADIKSKDVGDFGVSFGSGADTTAAIQSGALYLKKYLADNLPTLKRYMKVNI